MPALPVILIDIMPTLPVILIDHMPTLPVILIEIMQILPPSDSPPQRQALRAAPTDRHHR